MSMGDLDQDNMLECSGARIAKFNRTFRAMCISHTGGKAILEAESKDSLGCFVSVVTACPWGIPWWEQWC
jgi:hypothetical protein